MAEDTAETQTPPKVKINLGSGNLEMAKDVLSTEERINQAVELLSREAGLALPSEEAEKRINSLRQRIVFLDQEGFEGMYYDQYGQWDGVTAAFVYEPRRFQSMGRETEKQIFVLKRGLELTPETLQLVLHEGLHFLGQPTEVSRLPEWEVDELVPDEFYAVSTTILTDWLGPVSTTYKDSIFLSHVKKETIGVEIRLGAGIRVFNVIDSNVPIEELDNEYQIWEAVTDWYAMTLGKEVMPDYKPVTGYPERKVVEKYLEIAKKKGQEQEFKDAVGTALFTGDRGRFDQSLTSLGKNYSSFKSEVTS